MMEQRPAIAVLTPNVLTGLGLRALLAKIIPAAEVELFADFDALSAAGPERFYHYFVSVDLFGLHAEFFRARRQRTILLASSPAPALAAGMHTLDIRTSEERLVHDILRMHRSARHDHTAAPPAADDRPPLTDREAEVLRWIARGCINKQIAERLRIVLTTVITHRRNIMEKTGASSVADLVLYAVRSGYVDDEA